ncbi:hypothetical protein D3C87_2191720 [compost metagenome]
MHAHEGGEGGKERSVGEGRGFEPVFFGIVPSLGQVFERDLTLGLTLFERALARCWRED